MATTSTLTTINVFDSEDSYNANKNNIGENEISLVGLINNLVPVGGGIVAANLAQNGYVKFSNGLILQWGTVNGCATSVTFPVAFKSAVYAISSMYLTAISHGGMNLIAIPTLTEMTLKCSQSNNGAIFDGWQGGDTTSGTAKIAWLIVGQ